MGEKKKGDEPVQIVKKHVVGQEALSNFCDHQNHADHGLYSNKQ